MESKQENIAFLQEAKIASEQLKALKEQTYKKEIAFKKLSKEYEQETKAVEDSINITVKKRKSELEKSFDSEIEKADTMLRRAKDQRGEAKKSGQRARISEETADLRGSVRRYNTEVETLFKKNGVPGICNSRLFYALTGPSNFLDIIICVVTFALCFVIIPLLICKIFEVGALMVAVIYIVCILIFGGLYVGLFLKNKIRHADTLEQGKLIRKKMNADAKHIEAIKKSIINDKNEEMYNLGGFDEQISDIEADKNEVAKSKQAAVDDFEKNVKTRITEEIRANNKERLDSLCNQRNNAKHEFDEYSEKLQQQNLEVAQKYETVLGKDYDVESIDLLIGFFESGRATNISEAQSLYKMGAKPNFKEGEN